MELPPWSGGRDGKGLEQGLQRGSQSEATAEGSHDGSVHPSQSAASVWGGLSGRTCELCTRAIKTQLIMQQMHSYVKVYI